MRNRRACRSRRGMQLTCSWRTRLHPDGVRRHRTLIHAYVTAFLTNVHQRFTPQGDVGGIPVIVDQDGNITSTVDLGRPHDFRQYTPAAKALEAAGGS
jgi:hypothetical protein